MKIISVDPGYDRLGVAVIEKENTGKELLLFSDCFRTDSKDDFDERLFSVISEFEETTRKFSPTELAVEKLFFEKNQKTAMRVSQVIGALIFSAKSRGLSIAEYTPLQIKTATTGSGSATKQEMMKMVPLLINCPKLMGGEKMLDDEYDAIAVGLTHLAMRKAQRV